MPAGSAIISRPGGFLVEHVARGETLEIFIDEIYCEQEGPAGFTGELRKMGAEREFSDLIAGHLDRLGPPGSLELIAREWRTPAGPVDLLLRDTASGAPVVVEVKRNRISWGDAYQLRRYADALRSMPEWEQHVPQGILVAPVLAKNAKPLIDADPDLRYVRLAYRDLAA